MFQSIAIILIFGAVLYVLARPVIRGAVYMPAPREAVKAMIELAKPGPGEKIADLGSGDGRVLIAFAAAGAEAEGYEVNPLLVLLSRRRIARAGMERLARVHWKSFWREDLSGFDTVTVFGYPTIMKQLGGKLSREMKPGSEVVSLLYALPDREPIAVKDAGRSRVFLYRNAGNARNA